MTLELPVLTDPVTRTPAGVFGSLLAGLIGFAGVAAWGVQRTPWPEDFPVSVKIEHLAEHAEDYDAIFIGSSNVFRSFVPEVIDPRLAEAGIPLRTFNLGGPGMYSFETDYVLRRVLELYASRGATLKFVFIEPGNWEADSETEPALANMLSNRSVFFHDLRQTSNVVRSIDRMDAPLGQRGELAAEHLHAFARKLTSYGQGPRILDDFRGKRERHPITRERVAGGHGYQALEELTGIVAKKRRALLLDDIPGYHEKIRATMEANRRELDSDAYCRRAIEEQRDFIRAAGAEPIYVLPPASLRGHHALRLRDEGVIRLIAFNDAEEYPQFYVDERRYDPNHLDQAGAVEFSELFADELVRFLRAEL